MKTAFLIDGGFFLFRYQRLKGEGHDPNTVAKNLHAMCFQHLRKLRRPDHAMYRIFYYDCPPLAKKVHNPVDQRAIDFARTEIAKWRHSFFDELRRLRKVALRLGYVDENYGRWMLREEVMKRLLRREITLDDLTPTDVKYEARQKGVDMRIGLDIASLAYKRQVDQIVLVAGDSDFVPAAKLARREGIDFILDPMWHNIRDDLHEHVDGLQGTYPNVNASMSTVTIVEPPHGVTIATEVPPLDVGQLRTGSNATDESEQAEAE